MLILDSLCEWYYHIGIPYLDGSLQSELLFKEKEKKEKENYYVYGTDSRNFLKKYIFISHADGTGYFYYEVTLFQSGYF